MILKSHDSLAFAGVTAEQVIQRFQVGVDSVERSSARHEPKGDLTPGQAAKRLGKSRNFVLAIIANGELEAYDERSPGTRLNRYRIPQSAVDGWRATRRVTSRPSLTVPIRSVAMLDGVLAKRRANRNAAAARKNEDHDEEATS